ncbi:hypothetical protein CES86_0389 [Brucella lupini]|uniref:Uncharacterized protein n=1 Tax=Brucella lupini TaxID=255457 RepID=A0A256GXT7_9HYPH|nr:hypothetical protein CES86_0389 [Brucella lupini]
MLRGRAPTGIRVPRVPGIFSISQDVISIIRISDFLECTFPHSSALTWKRAANMSGYIRFAECFNRRAVQALLH